MTKTFDTLAFASALVEGGFTEQQAKALANALAELIDTHLATKADIQALRDELHAMEQRLEERFDRKLEKLKAELIQWMFGAVFGVLVLQTGINALMFKLLH